MSLHFHTKRAFSSLSRGFNLIEAAIVLGVIGLVIGGIWVAASAVNYNYAMNQTALGAMQALNNLRAMYAKMPCPGGSTYIDPKQIDLGLLSTWPVGPGAWNTIALSPSGLGVSVTIQCASAYGEAIQISIGRMGVAENYTFGQCLTLTPKMGVKLSSIGTNITGPAVNDGNLIGMGGCPYPQGDVGYYFSYR